MADRIAVMKDGRIHQVGSPLNIYREPVNLFVAGFFGVPSMNFVDGVIGSDKKSFVFGSGKFAHKLHHPISSSHLPEAQDDLRPLVAPSNHTISQTPLLGDCRPELSMTKESSRWRVFWISI